MWCSRRGSAVSWRSWLATCSEHTRLDLEDPRGDYGTRTGVNRVRPKAQSTPKEAGRGRSNLTVSRVTWLNRICVPCSSFRVHPLVSLPRRMCLERTEPEDLPPQPSPRGGGWAGMRLVLFGVTAGLLLGSARSDKGSSARFWHRDPCQAVRPPQTGGGPVRFRG
jgi:hypothetical protein